MVYAHQLNIPCICKVCVGCIKRAQKIVRRQNKGGNQEGIRVGKRTVEAFIQVERLNGIKQFASLHLGRF